MKQYFISGNTVQRKDVEIVLPLINYDSVVDKSTFSLEADRENARKSLISGSSSIGVYDSDVDNVSELAVKVRSGKLDKAEISMIQKGLKKDIDKQISDDKKAAAKAEADKIAEARQAYLDTATGFKGSPVEN